MELAQFTSLSYDLIEMKNLTSSYFTDRPIWVPKSVVGHDKFIKQWFIDLKDKELKNFMKPRKQSDLDKYF